MTDGTGCLLEDLEKEDLRFLALLKSILVDFIFHLDLKVFLLFSLSVFTSFWTFLAKFLSFLEDMKLALNFDFEKREQVLSKSEDGFESTRLQLILFFELLTFLLAVVILKGLLYNLPDAYFF